MNTIESLIVDRISELLDLVQIDDFRFEVEKRELLEATAIRGKTGERTCLIKVEVRESNKAIYIPNIVLPLEMRHLGLGRRMKRKTNFTPNSIYKDCGAMRLKKAL